MQRIHNSAYQKVRSLTRALSSFHVRPRMEIIFNYRHDLVFVPEVAGPPDCDIRQLGPEDIPLLRQVWSVPLDRMYKRLRRGDQCYSAFIEGKIAHYLWIQTRGWHYIQPASRWTWIRERELMIYHVRVAEWARGRRIDPFVKTFILRKFKQAGFRTAWIYTTSSNLASQSGSERAGWTFDEGYRALDFGAFRLPLPGSLKTKAFIA